MRKKPSHIPPCSSMLNCSYYDGKKPGQIPRALKEMGDGELTLLKKFSKDNNFYDN